MANISKVKVHETVYNVKDSIARPITGTADPNNSTIGSIGQHYINTVSGAEWVCTNIQNGIYTWVLKPNFYQQGTEPSAAANGSFWSWTAPSS